MPEAVDSSTIEVTKMISSASVQWTPVEDSYYPVNYYYLRLSSCDDSSSHQNCQLVNTFKSIDNTTAYTFDNLAPFTVYSLEVAAENSVGIGPYSEPVTVQCKSKAATCSYFPLYSCTPAIVCIYVRRILSLQPFTLCAKYMFIQCILALITSLFANR